jgi:hypothetical protein
MSAWASSASNASVIAVEPVMSANSMVDGYGNVLVRE